MPTAGHPLHPPLLSLPTLTPPYFRPILLIYLRNLASPIDLSLTPLALSLPLRHLHHQVVKICLKTRILSIQQRRMARLLALHRTRLSGRRRKRRTRKTRKTKIERNGMEGTRTEITRKVPVNHCKVHLSHRFPSLKNPRQFLNLRHPA
jgi:hypothetical protein